MKKKYKIPIAIGCFMIVAGLGIFLYSPISNYINAQRMNKSVNDYDDAISNMYNDTDTSQLEREIEQISSERSTDYTVSDYVKDKNIKADTNSKRINWALISLLHEQMTEYNSELLEYGQYELNDPFAYEQASFDLASYSLYDNVFGHICAPSIDMDLPIYLGANQYNMNFGAVHLSYSSMPIGGNNTNAVFAAHRGYIGKIFFDNIVFLEEGDDVYITNPWGKLHYRVAYTEVISPYDIQKCYIQENRDLITLLTCHPYGYSDYRYMVVCERAEEEREQISEEE